MNGTIAFNDIGIQEAMKQAAIMSSQSKRTGELSTLDEGEQIVMRALQGGGEVKHKGFSGQVNYKGKKVDVVDGKANVDGEVFVVSDDGKLVVNKDRQFVGSIQDGEFLEATPELIHQLEQQGVFEK